MTQNQYVLELLKSGKHLTSLQAALDYHITRLPSRICDLRQEGHIIGSVSRKTINSFGHTSRYCEYFLVKEKEVE